MKPDEDGAGNNKPSLKERREAARQKKKEDAERKRREREEEKRFLSTIDASIQMRSEINVQCRYFV